MLGFFAYLCLLAQPMSVTSLEKPRTSRASSVRTMAGQPNPPLGSLHDVVGPDGVLLIHLERAGRKEHEKLKKVGIYPTLFPATDYKTATAQDLNNGCVSANASDTASRCTGFDRTPGGIRGDGCMNPTEQAIAESHRRALFAAQARNATWTAILEDDVIPNDPEHWNENFKKLWAQVPPEVGFVRLGWCTFPEQEGNIQKNTFAEVDNWRIVDEMRTERDGWYHAGGCTTGYMVHRDTLPLVLRLFPCCGPMDACFEHELFYWPAFCRVDQLGCWGQQHMMGLDVNGTEEATRTWTSMTQNGILVQDNRETNSTQLGWDYRPH